MLNSYCFVVPVFFSLEVGSCWGRKRASDRAALLLPGAPLLPGLQAGMPTKLAENPRVTAGWAQCPCKKRSHWKNLTASLQNLLHRCRWKRLWLQIRAPHAGKGKLCHPAAPPCPLPRGRVTPTRAAVRALRHALRCCRIPEHGQDSALAVDVTQTIDITQAIDVTQVALRERDVSGCQGKVSPPAFPGFDSLRRCWSPLILSEEAEEHQRVDLP